VHLANYLGLLEEGERTLASSYREVAKGHAAEPDVFHTCLELAEQCDSHVERLAPLVERYGEDKDDEPERLHAEGLAGTRSGALGLLRDLHDLYMLANYLDMAWTMVAQAGQGARDREILDVVGACESQTKVQIAWIKTRMKQAAPQALLVAS
jgi:hypothetical protein